MEFDIKKIEMLALHKNRNMKIDFTDEEINFMANIYNTIINSDNYDSISEYLAGIYGMSISDIKFIRNVYYYYFADSEEKKIYNEKMKTVRQERTKKGFIDLSVVITLTIFIGIIGITLAILIYNLL